MSFTLNEELTLIGGLENKTVSAPREHTFTMQSVGGQTLAVFTEASSGKFLFSSAKHQLWTPLLQDDAINDPQIVLFKCSVMLNVFAHARMQR